MPFMREGSRKIVHNNLSSFFKSPKTILLITALTVVIFDQVSKFFALNFLETVVFKNSGVAFGVLSEWALILVFFGLSILTLLILKIPTLTGDRIASIGFGAFAGGGFSNLIDRLRFGYVVDFISILIWPSFNLADCAIVLGVVVVIIRMAILFKRERF